MDEVLDNDAGVVMENAPIITKTKAIYNFTNLTQTDLALKVEEFLKKKGYKLESGENHNGIYGKGSRVGRILLGAFIKRFAWQIKVEPNGNLTTLTIFKEAKGYVGGIIGVNQVNKEFDVIVNSLIQFHLKREA